MLGSTAEPDHAEGANELSDSSNHAPRGILRLRGLRDDFGAFMQLETAGAVVLLAATIIALVLANTDVYVRLEGILHTELGISVGSWHSSSL